MTSTLNSLGVRYQPSISAASAHRPLSTTCCFATRYTLYTHSPGPSYASTHDKSGSQESLPSTIFFFFLFSCYFHPFSHHSFLTFFLFIYITNTHTYARILACTLLPPRHIQTYTQCRGKHPHLPLLLVLNVYCLLYNLGVNSVLFCSVVTRRWFSLLAVSEKENNNKKKKKKKKKQQPNFRFLLQLSVKYIHLTSMYKLWPFWPPPNTNISLD